MKSRLVVLVLLMVGLALSACSTQKRGRAKKNNCDCPHFGMESEPSDSNSIGSTLFRV